VTDTPAPARDPAPPPDVGRMGAGEAEPEDVLFEKLWSRVLEEWDDLKTHNAFLDYAIRAERLPDAAGRYRSFKDDPQKGEFAKKRLDAIVLAATQMLYAMKTPPRGKVPLPITLSAFLMCVILLGWVYYLVFRRH
jgi:hypothetical protein